MELFKYIYHNPISLLPILIIIIIITMNMKRYAMYAEGQNLKQAR